MAGGYRTKRSNKQQKRKILSAKYDANLMLMESEYYFCRILVFGFFRSVPPSNTKTKYFSRDIETLCAAYFGFSIPTLPISHTRFIKLHYKTKVMEIWFDERYYELYSYQQRLICRQILLTQYGNDYYSTLTLNAKRRRYILSETNKYPAINFLSGMECILSMHTDQRKKQIKCLNLSNLDMNDEDIWHLCQLIENVSNYHESMNNKSWGLNLESLDLSNNTQITDKYLPLLSQKISNHLPKFKNLNLNATSISTKSIPIGLFQYLQTRHSSNEPINGSFKQKKRKKKKYKSGNWMS